MFVQLMEHVQHQINVNVQLVMLETFVNSVFVMEKILQMMQLVQIMGNVLHQKLVFVVLDTLEMIVN